MKTKIDLSEAKKIPVGDVLNTINSGIEVVGAVAPVLSVLFDKIFEAFSSIGKKRRNTIKALNERVEILEAQNLLQKEVNKDLQNQISQIKK